MTTTRSITALMIIAMVCLSCHNNTRIQRSGMLPLLHDPSISDELGVPHDSTSLYFPRQTFRDSIHYILYHNVVEIVSDNTEEQKQRVCSQYGPRSTIVFRDSFAFVTDSIPIRRESYLFYTMREPILCNFPVKKAVYRFILRGIYFKGAYHGPAVIAVEREREKVYVRTKLFQYSTDTRPPFDNRSGTYNDPPDLSYEIHSRKQLSEKDYDDLTTLVKAVKLTGLPWRPYIHGSYLDGSEWTLEIQNDEGYYVTWALSPNEDSPVHKVGDWLISHSDLKNEMKH
jgi:hypothetical protein